MRQKLINNRGFGLIEVLVLIVVIGIAAATALQWMTASIDDIRTVKTEREMEMLSNSIVGDPNLTQNGIRSDFGYVGDIGSFPPNLQALFTNPGYSTWDGPYLAKGYAQDSAGFAIDEWGTAYTYVSGVTITSSGSGSSIQNQFANATSDYLLNTLNGTIKDAAGSAPGINYTDSIDIVITIPNGLGGTISKIYNPDVSGNFTLDSLPAGQRQMDIVYTPDVDTLHRFVTILPRHKSSHNYKFATAYFTASTVGGFGGHWKLDDLTGLVALDDKNNSHGTLYNMNGTEWTTGKVDGALEFDGSNDYIHIPHHDSLNGTTELTYSAWFYSHTWSGSIRQIMAKSVHGGGSGRAQMGIFREGSLLKGRAETNGGRRDVTTPLPALNSWVHVAVVFDGTSLTIYLNGVEENSITFSSTTLLQTTDELCISKRVGTNQYYFNGLIDDVRVYTRALSGPEILALYNMGS